MNHRIRSVLGRALARLLAPPAPVSASRTATGRCLVVRRSGPLRVPAPLRAATGADAPVLDPGGPLVRPYLVAHEQRDRRIALALALDGIDVGPWVIHGRLVGVGGTV
ncbi:hypothetical protein [Streptomyces roseoviridis]|uniref:Uncharacterized protein n=1 Tax=Streptomyces roseoviridis TaxID=67361 RepID=A0ABV5QLZ8_9ACTN